MNGDGKKTVKSVPTAQKDVIGGYQAHTIM